MNTGKALVGLVWVLCVAAFLMPPDWTAASLGRSLFWLLVVVHAIECVVFLSTLKRAPGPLSAHLVQTMLYGLFHLREIRDSGPTQNEGS